MATALQMVFAYYGSYPSVTEIDLACQEARGQGPVPMIREAAERYGFAVSEQKCSAGEILDIYQTEKRPVIIVRRKKYCVLARLSSKNVTIHDCAKGKIVMTREKFLHEYGGSAILLSPSESFQKYGKKKGIVYHLRRRISEYKGDAGKTMLFHGLSVLLQAAMAFGIKYLADNVEFLDQWHVRTFLLVIMYGLLALQGLCMIAERKASYQGSLRASRLNSEKLFRKILSLPALTYERYGIGDYVKRMDAAATIDSSILRILIPGLTDVWSLFLYFMLVCYYDYRLACVCLVIELVFVLLTAEFQEKISILSNSITNTEANLSTVTLRGFDTISTTKSISAESTFFSQWRRHETTYLQARKSTQRMMELTHFFSGCHDALMDAALLFVGAGLIIQGDFSLGTIISIQTMIRRIQKSLRGTTLAAGSLSKCYANLSKAEDLLSQESRPVYDQTLVMEGKVSGDLVVEDVSFTYPDNTEPTLRHVSFTVKEGQTVALVGRSGCGKSTLLKILQGSYQPQSGKVLYGGYERQELSDEVFHASLLAVNQVMTIFRDTIRNNITMWNPAVSQEAMELAAKQTDIHDRIMAEPKRYESEMQQNGIGFSGGELQRMELTSALAGDPTFLLLDEFTSSQDALRESSAMKLLAERNITCLMAAHRVSLMTKADLILVMKDGEIVQQGTHEELIKEDGYYRCLIDIDNVRNQNERYM